MRFEHVWVDAYVPMFPSMGAANYGVKAWTVIDPSFKETIFKTGTNLSKTVVFDEMNYITSNDDRPPVLTYTMAFDDYGTAKQEDFIKYFYSSYIRPREFGRFLGTLQYKSVQSSSFSEIPSNKRHKIRFVLTTSEIGGDEEVYIDKDIPAIAGKKITFSYTPSTSEDQSTINYYGGLLHTPSYLIVVKPIIKMEDTAMLTGREMALGSKIKLRVELTNPSELISSKSCTNIATADISHGINYTIGLSVLNPSSQARLNQKDTLMGYDGNIEDSINAMDGRAGDLLNNIVMDYFAQLNMTARIVAKMMHIHNTLLPSVTLVSSEATYDEVFGVPVSPPILNGIAMDAIKLANSPISVEGDNDSRIAFVKHYGLNSSYLEHKVIENDLDTEAVSAVKALQIAAANNIPIYQIDSNNANSIIPTLTVDSGVISAIKNAISAGKEVIISRDNVSVNDWSGVGYIIRNPSTGAGAYMIYSLLNGSIDVEDIKYEFRKEYRMAYIILGYIHHFSEIVYFIPDIEDYEDAIYPIFTYFRYIPILWHRPSREDILVYILNNTKNRPWIFYYFGHGTNEAMTPEENDYRDRKIYYDDFKSDSKIVFINGCYAGESAANFVESFNIDGEVLDIESNTILPRNEAFIGWKESVFAPFAARAAFKFWSNMSKKNANTGNYTVVEEAVKNSDSALVFISKPSYSTTLVP
ncbi:MAG: hypothetical protein L3V56_10810 [Candidatus Magnetoovum sp. WYHC-5]|nr:hypothetical protein [Candidatus Magnetoovum sp. WYHC-5]